MQTKYLNPRSLVLRGIVRNAEKVAQIHGDVIPWFAF